MARMMVGDADSFFRTRMARITRMAVGDADSSFFEHGLYGLHGWGLGTRIVFFRTRMARITRMEDGDADVFFFEHGLHGLRGWGLGTRMGTKGQLASPVGTTDYSVGVYPYVYGYVINNAAPVRGA